MPFSTDYPYLNWWMNNHGYIQLGNDDDSYSDSILLVLDAGGTCWEDENSDTVEEALGKAEEYLRTEEIPDRFDPEVIREIEATLKKKKPGKKA